MSILLVDASTSIDRLPTSPEKFPDGQIADAEPAVPGLRIEVDQIFP